MGRARCHAGGGSAGDRTVVITQHCGSRTASRSGLRDASPRSRTTRPRKSNWRGNDTRGDLAERRIAVRAMALTGAGRGRLDPIEVEAPTPGPNDVRVRVLACGVCRTDLHVVFAPVGALVPEALSRVVPGGVVVSAGIHMSDIPAMPCRLLWGRTKHPVGCQFDAARRTRISRVGRPRAAADSRPYVCPGRRQQGAGRCARRAPVRRGGAGS
jgi:hypothetical protein